MARLRSKFRHAVSETIVQNPVASTQTGTASARIQGLHPMLVVGIGLAYYPDSKHLPASFGTNTFSIYQYDTNGNGETVQLSSTPINGATGQAAPDKWGDGVTVLPQLELRHSYQGLGASDVGHWEVIVTVAPAVEMCEELFEQLAGDVAIRILGNPVILS